MPPYLPVLVSIATTPRRQEWWGAERAMLLSLRSIGCDAHIMVTPYNALSNTPVRDRPRGDEGRTRIAPWCGGELGDSVPVLVTDVRLVLDDPAEIARALALRYLGRYAASRVSSVPLSRPADSNFQLTIAIVERLVSRLHRRENALRRLRRPCPMESSIPTQI